MSSKFYTEEIINSIKTKLSGKTLITKKEVQELSEEFNIPVKSLVAKLRTLGFQIEKTAEQPKTYTPQQEELIKEMVNRGYFIEDIAEKLGKTVTQIRGKLLSMKLKAPTKVKKQPKQKTYTQELLNQIQSRLQAGETLESIAESYGLNLKGLKVVLVKSGILPKQQKEKFWTDEKIKQAVDLFNSSKDTIDIIAEKIGCSINQLCKILKQAGLNYESRKPVKKFDDPNGFTV